MSASRSAGPASSPRPYIGGQAVLEGVMMRAPSSFAVVVRRRDGSLMVRERAMHAEGRGWAKFPLLRGLASLVESLRLGSEALRFSAEQMTQDLEDASPSPAARTPLSLLGGVMAAWAVLGAALRASGLVTFLLATAEDGAETPSAPDKKGSRGAMGFMLVIVLAFFIALPQGASALINRFFHLGLALQSPGFQLLTGALKLTIVVGYLIGIRRVPDIRRVFQYHGAEHKTISTYEANEPLEVAYARAKTTLHPRCGTTFIVMVALVSILVFTAIGSFLPRIHTGSEILDNVVFFLEKLPFLPVIVAVTFEIQRLFARYCTTGPLRALLWPGFLVQKITTIEPDDDQLEVALASLRATLFRQNAPPEAAVALDEQGDVTFPSYAAIAAAERLRSAA
jgi:uncharacterized protein YqhQ